MSDINSTPASTATPQDAYSAGSADDQLLDAILRNSPMLNQDETLPEEQSEIPATQELQEEDDQVPVENEEVVEEPVEIEAAAEDDTSTQEADVYTLDDLDDFQITHKIDGEDVTMPLSEWIKGSATNQHLTNKGRELGDARKALDKEREEKLAQIDNLRTAAEQMLMENENLFAKQYHSLGDDIRKAREEGDTYLVTELKDKQDVARENYAREKAKREKMIATANTQKEEVEQQAWKAKMEEFGSSISNIIPDWSEDRAMKIREFAIERNISEETIATMIDPNAIKVLDDLRVLESAKKKGVQKRAKAPVKSVPLRKGATAQERSERSQDALREKAFSVDASKEDQKEYLKSISKASSMF